MKRQYGLYLDPAAALALDKLAAALGIVNQFNQHSRAALIERLGLVALKDMSQAQTALAALFESVTDYEVEGRTLTDVEVREIRERRKGGESLKSIADRLGRDVSTVSRIASGKRRKSVK